MVMGEKMTSTNYLMIQDNVVTNSIMWSGDTNEWQPPADATMLVNSQTIALVWEITEDKTDFYLKEVLGAGDIGFTYDGSKLTTNQEKPQILQPASDLQAGTIPQTTI